MSEVEVADIFIDIWSVVLDPIYAVFRFVLFLIILSVVVFVGSFIIKIFPFVKVFLQGKKVDALSVADSLARIRLKFLPYDLFRWIVVDALRSRATRDEFKEYGITFYVGRQGGGKTTSMVRHADDESEIPEAPDCIEYRN